jgi:serine/threonine protein kinase
MGICHRDIKPENILLTDKDLQTAIFKVSDFGMARFIDGEQALATTMCGSPAYVAPEVLLQENNSEEGYDKVCDFWSIGVILFYLLCGKKPFECEDNFELYEMIKEGDYGDFMEPCWKNVSDDCKDLLKKLLVVDWKERIKGDEI